MKNNSNLLKEKYPEIFSQIDVERTMKDYPDLDIEKLSSFSHKKIWWKCNKNPNHTWKANISGRCAHNYGCPICTNRLLVKGVNDLKTLYPELAKEFDEKLNGIKAEDVISGSNKIYYWRCSRHINHVWKETLNNRIFRNYGCPYCTNKKVLSGFNDLQTLYPDISKEFDVSLNNIAPNNILAGSGAKYYWRCSKYPSHIWQCPVRDRTKLGHNCPYCSNHKLLTGFNDLQTKYPDITKEFASDLNNITPDKVLFGSSKKYYWRCSKNSEHIWKTSIRDRTGKSQSNCPFCSHKHSTPELLFHNLCLTIDKKSINGYKVNGWEFDEYVPSINTLFEYDGLAYHSDDSIFVDSNITRQRENIKNNIAKKANISVIRIRETRDKIKLETRFEIVDGIKIFCV